MILIKSLLIESKSKVSLACSEHVTLTGQIRLSELETELNAVRSDVG